MDLNTEFLPLLPDEGIGRGEAACGVIGDDGAAAEAYREKVPVKYTEKT